MIARKKDLENFEKKTLAPYAFLSSKSRGRRIFEKPDPSRTEFQRDRDRIIYSKAFRRLSGKTQVFVATYGDHFRDRLSHTLEVAQIARGLARNLRLNEDLCEAIALAHDLGHTPFGHAGEETLNKIMKKFGKKFEHNEQSKRIVEELEKQFPNFDGLNLTYEVRQGLAKHKTHYDQRGKRVAGETLEAQVADIADEIAYHSHDLDDGLRSGLFDFKDLSRLELWKSSFEACRRKYGEILDDYVLRSRVISNLISVMMEDALKTSAYNLRRLKIKKASGAEEQNKNIVCLSAPFLGKIKKLRQFLWIKMYQSPRILKHSKRGQKILQKLFWKIYKNPQLLPRRFCERINAPDPLDIVVKDYAAGCTDAYAMNLLFDRKL